ncbi:Enterobactin exporter EntS [Pseudonocardia sp. Ae717_Ps2]|uniref:MFS transporter n=1 Tax=unclassified Pseudonocardia TaxID=2619320 RepID=UPI00094B6B95|nr:MULTISPECIES: MFS transporter [unclassified Pseudonocardia]OLM14207.1 Enterobactin exporter EntS [Pseudonocardia sp. Ae505_Ps2]OLM31375.1 Enterobactin exporter EntS [Pseudonocardia sp. Ae717_Ps2]
MASLLVDVSPLREDRTFRNLFVARTILLFGVGIVAVTVPLEVYGRTGSTPVVGMVTAIESVAFVVGYLGGGVLADRVDRWLLVRVTWLISGTTFAGLAVNAAWIGSTPLTAALVAANGLSGATCITAMLAVTPSIVDRAKLHAVGALNTVSLRLGAVVAPAVGGIVFAVASAAWNYTAGALAAAVTWALLMVAPPPGRGRTTAAASAGPDGDGPDGDQPGAGGGDGAPQEPVESPLAALRSGARFAVREPVVFGVMVAGLVGMVGGGSFVLVPAFVEARFGGSSTVVGLMYSALAAGVVLGSLGSGWVRRSPRPGRLLLALMVLCYACYALAGAAPTVALVLAALVAAGATNAIEEVLRYTLLQLRTPDALLGRVNSLFAAQAMTGAAIGAVVAGFVGGLVGDGDALWFYNTVTGLVAAATGLLLGPLRRVTRASIEEER